VPALHALPQKLVNIRYAGASPLKHAEVQKAIADEEARWASTGAC
jgi:hypothetical protein